jgi:SAM-dependent methyltransferase
MHLKTNGLLYLDIGTFTSYNATVFGKDYDEIVGLDIAIPKTNILRKSPKAYLITGDGLNLPLSSGRFDLVSLFSVIEHVSNPENLLKEAFRVANNDGILIIQIPNKYFPIEVHSGLPFFFYVPKRLRNFFIKKSNIAWMAEVNVPSLKELMHLIKTADSSVQITLTKVRYPPTIIAPGLKSLYRIFARLGLLDVVPIGYLLSVKKPPKNPC